MDKGCVLMVLMLVKGAACAHNWNYDPTDAVNGPDHWKDSFPICGFDRQTPIDINTDITEYSSDLVPLTLINYNNDTIFNLTSNGDRAKLIPVENPPKLAGGNLSATYTFLHFHVHWGENNSVGSEHHINGTSYAGEIHIVHGKDGHTYDEIQNLTDGMAVISLLLQAGGPENQAYKRIIDNLEEIPVEGATYTLDGFPLNEMLPKDVTSYYRFQGSRNVPPCSQAVVWSVMKEPVVLSDDQFARLRTFKNGNITITRNYRPIQLLNGRKIYRSWSSGVRHTADLIIWMLTAAVVVWSTM